METIFIQCFFDHRVLSVLHNGFWVCFVDQRYCGGTHSSHSSRWYRGVRGGSNWCWLQIQHEQLPRGSHRRKVVSSCRRFLDSCSLVSLIYNWLVQFRVYKIRLTKTTPSVNSWQDFSAPRRGKYVYTMQYRDAPSLAGPNDRWTRSGPAARGAIPVNRDGLGKGMLPWKLGGIEVYPSCDKTGGGYMRGGSSGVFIDSGTSDAQPSWSTDDWPATLSPDCRTIGTSYHCVMSQCTTSNRGIPMYSLAQPSDEF